MKEAIIEIEQGGRGYRGRICEHPFPDLPADLTFVLRIPTPHMDEQGPRPTLSFRSEGRRLGRTMRARVLERFWPPINIVSSLYYLAVKQRGPGPHQLTAPVFEDGDDLRTKNQPMALARVMNGLTENPNKLH